MFLLLKDFKVKEIYIEKIKKIEHRIFFSMRYLEKDYILFNGKIIDKIMRVISKDRIKTETYDIFNNFHNGKITLTEEELSFLFDYLTSKNIEIKYLDNKIIINDKNYIITSFKELFLSNPIKTLLSVKKEFLEKLFLKILINERKIKEIFEKLSVEKRFIIKQIYYHFSKKQFYEEKNIYIPIEKGKEEIKEEGICFSDDNILFYKFFNEVL